MRHTKIAAKTAGKTAALAIAGLLVTSATASAQLCLVPLIISAFHVSATENRELTQKEAMTCGLIREKPAAKNAAKAKNKAARRAQTNR